MNNETKTKRGFFYCYSPGLHNHIKSKGLNYVGTGLHESTLRKFWQYERGNDLDEAINEWQANNPNK